MKEEKITAAEVQLLRKNAEEERTRHALTMELIRKMENSSSMQPLSKSDLMGILVHKRESEIIELLDVYDEKNNAEFTFPEEAQLFIYDDANKMPAAKERMIKNHILCLAVEKRIFDDDKPLFFEDAGQSKEFFPKFSAEGEKYIVMKTLEKCQKANKITTEMYFLIGYTKRREFSACAQIALMDYLTVSTGRDSVIDTLESFVIDYIGKYQNLDIPAQMKLIRSGNHKAIMYYIEKSLNGIQDQEVINELIDVRGDKEEVTAYFNRYANEE